MWFLMRRIMAYGRWIAWMTALGAAGAVYAHLSTREQITILGGEPHIIEWWEPYAWPAVTFIIVGRVVRMVLKRTVGTATAKVARLKRAGLFGPKGE